MPMIDLYHQEGSFTPETQAVLVNDLTALLLEMEGAHYPIARDFLVLPAYPARRRHQYGRAAKPGFQI
jgi:hypothetical protein